MVEKRARPGQTAFVEHDVESSIDQGDSSSDLSDENEERKSEMKTRERAATGTASAIPKRNKKADTGFGD